MPADSQGKHAFELTAEEVRATVAKIDPDNPTRDLLMGLMDKADTRAGELGQTEDEVLVRIDYPSYFDLTDQPLPNDRRGIVERLSQDRIIALDVGGRWNITHLGAILFAKRLDQFDSSIARKAVRFTSYDGPSRADTVIHRYEEPRG